MKELPQDVTEEDRRAIAKNEIELEKALGVAKGKPMSVEEADHKHANPLFTTSKSYRINCQTCSPAYMLRTRGFDITAGPNTRRAGNLSHYLSYSKNFWNKYLNADGTPAKHHSIVEWAKAKKLTTVTAEDYFKFYDEFTKKPGIYEVAVSWERGGGHSTPLQRFSDGTLKRIDAQTWIQADFTAKNMLCTSAKHTGLHDMCDGIMRIDDKVFNAKYAKIFRKTKK